MSTDVWGEMDVPKRKVVVQVQEAFFPIAHCSVQGHRCCPAFVTAEEAVWLSLQLG